MLWLLMNCARNFTKDNEAVEYSKMADMIDRKKKRGDDEDKST